MLLVYQVIYF